MEFIGSVFSNLLCFADWSAYIPELNVIGKIVQAMYNWLGNYGITVIVFTVFLKIITTPLDLWQRVVTKKSSLKMAQIQPMLAKIDKQFANDQRRANEEKQKIYKKQGYNALSSCLPMLVTMAVFIFMFSGLNSYSAYINVKNYVDLDNAYEVAYDQAIAQGKTSSQAIEYAQGEVGDYYVENIQESFLWIKNIWRPDTWNSVMATADNFKNGGQGTRAIDKNSPFEQARYEVIYKAVVTADPGYFAQYDSNGDLVVKNGKLKSGWNGLLVLPVITIGLAFLSSWVTSKQTKGKNAAEVNPNDPNQQSQKMMMWMMPVMFGVFGFIYTAAFAIYMAANSLLSLFATVIFNGLINKWAEESIAKANAKLQPKESYRR